MKSRILFFEARTAVMPHLCGGAGATGMTNRQEVKIRTGALTKGTRHRGNKGVDLEHQILAEAQPSVGPRGEVWWKL